MASKLEDIERRLLNWARWKAGAGVGGLGYASVNMLAALSGGSRAAADPVPIPTMAIEAEETDRAVLALPSELRRTVEVVYLGRGGMPDHAQALAAPVATVKARVCRAHKSISNWLSDLAQTREGRRENALNLQSIVLRNIPNR